MLAQQSYSINCNGSVAISINRWNANRTTGMPQWLVKKTSSPLPLTLSWHLGNCPGEIPRDCAGKCSGRNVRGFVGDLPEMICRREMSRTDVQGNCPVLEMSLETSGEKCQEYYVGLCGYDCATMVNTLTYKQIHSYRRSQGVKVHPEGDEKKFSRHFC